MIGVIYGSVRDKRVGIGAARFFVNHLAKQDREAVLIDPVEHRLDLLDKRLVDYKDAEPPPTLAGLRDILRKCASFIAVTAEYNHLPPPALINLVDHFGPPEFRRKPVGIVSYSGGRYGGVRAAEQLRLLFPGIGGITAAYAVAIPAVGEQFGENGELLQGPWEEEAGKLVDELDFWSGRARPSA